jgi:uncharacterized protein (TIGR02246 family)
MHKLAALICFLVATPAALAQDKTTIEGLNQRFMAAFSSGDFGTVAAMYTEDAYLLPPGLEMIKGRAAIQAFWTRASEAIRDVELTTVDVKPLGTEAAREVGTFRLKIKGAETQEIIGKYVVVWQRVGSDWKLATDMWNTSK